MRNCCYTVMERVAKGRGERETAYDRERERGREGERERGDIRHSSRASSYHSIHPHSQSSPAASPRITASKSDMDSTKDPSNALVLEFKEDPALTEVSIALLNHNFSPPVVTNPLNTRCRILFSLNQHKRVAVLTADEMLNADIVHALKQDQLFTGLDCILKLKLFSRVYKTPVLKGTVNPKIKSHYPLSSMLMESQVKIHRPQNISGASQQKSAAVFSKTTEVAEIPKMIHKSVI